MAALLSLQLLALVLASGPLLQPSVFCTGLASSGLGGLFTSLHLLFLFAFFCGALSLLVSWLRLPYALLLLVGLPALPVQAWLVSNGTLTCDFP